MRPATSSNWGFTLIELMIMVAVVAILASIAYPSYRSYLIRSNRTDAQQVLLQTAQDMERYFARQNTYAAGTASHTCSPEPCTGSNASRKVYDIAVQGTPTATVFVIRATPTSGRLNATDGYLEITNTGLKRWDKNNDGDTADSGEDSWTKY